MTKNNVYTLVHIVVLFLFVLPISNAIAYTSQATVNVPGPLFITILGSNPVRMIVGTSYTDAGATVLDTSNGEVPVATILNNVNTSVVGSYSVVYRAVDIAGSVATATRVVNVVFPAPRRKAQAPDITVDVGGDIEPIATSSPIESIGGQIPNLPVDFCFNKNLSSNTSDADVKNLQIFLNSQGFFVIQGGSENNYYGKETVNAIKLFQAQNVIVPFMPFNSIPATGNFDDATRMKANDILGCSTATEPAKIGIGGEVTVVAPGDSLASTTSVSAIVPSKIATNTLNQANTNNTATTTTINASNTNINIEKATSSVNMPEAINNNIFQKFINYIIRIATNFAIVFKSFFGF